MCELRLQPAGASGDATIVHDLSPSLTGGDGGSTGLLATTVQCV